MNGEQATLGVSTERLMKVVHSTFWLLSQKTLNRKYLQVICGRWVFILQCRRPAMSVLEKAWKHIGSTDRCSLQDFEDIRGELFSLIGICPLLHCFLGAEIDDKIFA